MPPEPQIPSPEFLVVLKQARVCGFRTLTEVTVDLEPGLTVLIGENNSGKTSFLEALAVAFGERRPRIDDLHRSPSQTATEITIDLWFTPTRGGDFPEPIVDVVGEAVQLDQPTPYFIIRTAARRSDSGEDLRLSRSFLKLAENGREVMQIPTVRRELTDLLGFDLVDARRDIVEELRNKRSFWGRTLENLRLADDERAHVEDQLGRLSDEIIEQSPLLRDLQSALKQLSSGLAAGDLGVQLEPLPQRVDELFRSMEILVSAHRSDAFSIARQGMGTRSLAVLLTFHAYVRLVRLADERLRQGVSLAAFEEPEAHLHPQAQRAIFKLLEGLHGQRVLSTHSSHVAANAPLGAMRLFRRSEGATAVYHYDPNTLQHQDEREKLRRNIQDLYPELLFARAVILVEGESEYAAFPVFARAYWPPRGLDSLGVTLVHTGGAGNGKHFAPLLEALKIPWLIFCDGDDAGTKGLSGLSTALGRTLNDSSPEVVALPNGKTWETFLCADPDRVRALRQRFDTDLNEFKRTKHGQRKKNGSVMRDYQSNGWEGRLLEDWLDSDNGTKKGEIAETFVCAAPARVTALQQKIAGELTNYKMSWDGQTKNGNVLRDYRSTGWEDRLLEDWLSSVKGTKNREIAEIILGTPVNPDKIPDRIRELFTRLSTRLGTPT